LNTYAAAYDEAALQTVTEDKSTWHPRRRS